MLHIIREVMLKLHTFLTHSADSDRWRAKCLESRSGTQDLSTDALSNPYILEKKQLIKF